jgi:hypothetical protein
MKKIEKIVILGGGTAGWVTALNFIQKTFDTKITVISSKEIPIIGVGESTTGLFNNLINYTSGELKIDELDFAQKTNSTIKLGIVHKDWHTIGEEFTSPLGDEFLNETGRPCLSYDYYRIYHIAKNLKYEQTASQFMMQDKLPFLFVDKNDPYLSVFNNRFGKIDFKLGHVAYHLDAFKVASYLKDVVLQSQRSNYIEDIVVSANKNEDGTIKSVITKNGNVIEGDLFVDCTGFFRVLIEKQFDNKFISWEDNLLTNCAITFPKVRLESDKIKNFTKAIARKYGWQWEIPLQNRIGRGYAFNSRMISPEQAHQELEESFGEKINIQQQINFTPGRLEKFWIKNVISTGLCVGFLEPLEATSIHMTILHINHFIEQYYNQYMNFNVSEQHDSYNRGFADAWDDLRDFIVLHFLSPRKDTEFWIESASEDRRSARLKNLLEIWKTRMPRYVDYKSSNHMNFYHLGNTLWYQILIGMKLLDSEIAIKELEGFNLMNVAENHYKMRNQFNLHLLKHAYDNDDFYKNQLKYFYEFHKVTAKVEQFF